MGSRSVRFLIGAAALGLVGGLLLTWVFMAALSLPAVPVRLWPAAYHFMAPAWILPLAGLLIALMGVMLVLGLSADDASDLPGVPPLVACVFLLALLAALDGKVSFLSAAVVVPLTCGAIAAVSRLLHALTWGGSVGIESRWGGLGGGLGGWRLSREASLLLLASVMVAGCIAALQPPSPAEAVDRHANQSDSVGSAKPPARPEPQASKPS